MSADNKLRRCGKKLPRHCDVNHDNRIAFTEWLNCLNVNHVQTQTQPNGNFLNKYNTYIKTENRWIVYFSYLLETSTIIAKRRGPNPLESYLKGED